VLLKYKFRFLLHCHIVYCLEELGPKCVDSNWCILSGLLNTENHLELTCFRNCMQQCQMHFSSIKCFPLEDMVNFILYNSGLSFILCCLATEM
jgi:hypothetical protein